MVKMGRMVKEHGIPHYGCVAHQLEKTSEHVYKHMCQDKIMQACMLVHIVFSLVQNDVKTSWWSSYIMCEGLMSMKKALKKVEGAEHAPPKLSDLDWWVIEVGLEILRPLMLAQLKLEGKQYVTGSLIIPMISEIHTRLLAVQEHLVELAVAVGDLEVEGREDFSVGSILDAMIQDFEYRWGDSADILCFKYGQHSTGKGQPCDFH